MHPDPVQIVLWTVAAVLFVAYLLEDGARACAARTSEAQ